MTHYTCKGECNGISETPVSCGAESCSLHNHPLAECNCEDGSHKGEEAAAEETPTEEAAQ